jgi:hypothetical protein
MSWFFVAVFAGASYWYVRKRRQRKASTVTGTAHI